MSCNFGAFPPPISSHNSRCALFFAFDSISLFSLVTPIIVIVHFLSSHYSLHPTLLHVFLFPPSILYLSPPSHTPSCLFSPLSHSPPCLSPSSRNPLCLSPPSLQPQSFSSVPHSSLSFLLHPTLLLDFLLHPSILSDVLIYFLCIPFYSLCYRPLLVLFPSPFSLYSSAICPHYPFYSFSFLLLFPHSSPSPTSHRI